MRPTDRIRTLFAFAVLVILHYSLRPLLGWRLAPDFLVIALLLVAVRVRPGTAALLGFAIGIVSDSLDLRAFGAGALGFTAVAFTASWLKAVFFADDLLLNGIFFFGGEWLFDTIYLLIVHRAGAGGLFVELLVWAPLTAGVTALFGLATLLVLRPILRPAES